MTNDSVIRPANLQFNRSRLAVRARLRAPKNTLQAGNEKSAMASRSTPT